MRFINFIKYCRKNYITREESVTINAKAMGKKLHANEVRFILH